MEMYDYAKASSSQNVYEEPTSIKPAPGVGEKTGEQSLAKAEVDVSNEADRREPTRIYSKAELKKSGFKCSNLCLIVTVVVLVVGLASAASYVTYLTTRVSALEDAAIERQSEPCPDQYKDVRAEIQDLEDRLSLQINSTHRDSFIRDQSYQATHQELFQMFDALNTSILSQRGSIFTLTQAQAINITSHLTNLIAAKTNNLSETLEADVRAEIQDLEDRLSLQINATHGDLFTRDQSYQATHQELFQMLNALNTSILAQRGSIFTLTQAQAMNITSHLTTLIAAKTNNLSDTLEADLRAEIQDLEDRLSSQINASRRHSINPVHEIHSSNQTYEDCQAAWEQGVRVAGVYRLSVGQLRTYDARCEFDDQHGWTVIQRRIDGSVNFYRAWDSYKRGFGDPHGEYWLGNEKIYSLTRRNRKLSIYLMRWDGDVATANYSNFYISNELDNYRLTISGYSGDARHDSMAYHNGSQFTTRDRDNDAWGFQCADFRKGAWWYNACAYSNLNGLYTNSSTGDITNMWWHGDWSGGVSRPLRKTTMMITRD